MLIHREKYNNHCLTLLMKMEHSPVLPGPSALSATPTTTGNLDSLLALDSNHQECATKENDARPSAESEIGNTQAKPHQRLDQSIDGVSARLADSSSPSISSSTTAPHATQTENLTTSIANDGSRGHVVKEEKAPHTMVSEMDVFSTQEETHYQIDRPAHELDAGLDRSSSAPPTALLPATGTEDHPLLDVKDDLKQRTTRLNEGIATLDDPVEKKRALAEKRRHIYQTANTVIKALDLLSEAHEIARAASIVVSGIYHVIKAKHEQNEAIVSLYDIMTETFSIVLDKAALNTRGHFTKSFNDIVRQSEECYVFLSNYMLKGSLRQLIDLWDTPSKIAEFTAAFELLKKQFIDAQIEVTTSIAIDAQKHLKSLERKAAVTMVTVLNTQKVVESIGVSPPTLKPKHADDEQL
ncbi:hypothetical protein VNI00_004681 [Paramarasmius palmivorus]|uniref:CID domain-containing protein n=1 Tax=Paramarasmius palmivorus TaxID=297713 RepID=A0AAW0DIS3_9AGAR